MRVLVGGMSHESNSLNPIITGAEDFVVLRGKEMLSRREPGAALTGILDTLEAAGCEIVPTLAARAVPNGVVSAAFYRELKEELLRRAQEAREGSALDGVCLNLHGSMKVEGLGCAEGDFCGALRALFPGVPFTASLDMHATITEALMSAVDGFAGYKTAPHVDCAETGAAAARMLLDALRRGKRPYTAWAKVPMLVAGEKSESAAPPMTSLVALLQEAEKEAAVERASLLMGFPWADDAHNGVSILVTVKDGAHREFADRKARLLAEAVWQAREEFAFHTESYASAQAIRVACEAVLEGGDFPVFVSDSGDNPTAGAAGDATELLEHILAAQDTVDRLPTPLLYSGFYDAPAAAACVKAGEGASVDVTVGGNWDTVNGKRLPLRLKVLKVVRGFGPYKADLALAAWRNIRLTLTSKHIGFGDSDLLPALGVDAGAYCLVVVKLGYLEPCFRAIAKRAILALSKGCSNEALETIPYKNVTRPLYPLDKWEGRLYA